MTKASPISKKSNEFGIGRRLRASRTAYALIAPFMLFFLTFQAVSYTHLFLFYLTHLKQQQRNSDFFATF